MAYLPIRFQCKLKSTGELRDFEAYINTRNIIAIEPLKEGSLIVMSDSSAYSTAVPAEDLVVKITQMDSMIFLSHN